MTKLNLVIYRWKNIEKCFFLKEEFNNNNQEKLRLGRMYILVRDELAGQRVELLACLRIYKEASYTWGSTAPSFRPRRKGILSLLTGTF